MIESILEWILLFAIFFCPPLVYIISKKAQYSNTRHSNKPLHSKTNSAIKP
jgi:hypothetical protein